MDYLFIVNPQSQTVRTKGSVLQTVKAGRKAELCLLDDFGVLEGLVERAIKHQTEWVFVEGGDGTTHGVLTAFLRRREDFTIFPKFTILPGGMTNQVARNIGLKRVNASRIESMIVNKPSNLLNFPVLKLDVPGSQAQYGFLFSSGGIPSATEYCTSKMYDKGLGGTLAVAATIARGVAGSKRIRDEMMPATPLDLRITGKREEIHLKDEHLATLVTTLPGLILNIDPFWGDGQGPLRLTYARADAQKMVRNLVSIWMGQKGRDRKIDGFESFNAFSLRYDYSGPVVLDGETIALPENRVIVGASEPVDFAV